MHAHFITHGAWPYELLVREVDAQSNVTRTDGARIVAPLLSSHKRQKLKTRM